MPLHWVCIAALLGVAVFFRFWKLGTVTGLNGDEAWFGIEAMRYWRGNTLTWHTPTYNALNPFWCGPLFALHRWFPPSIELLRALAVVSGCLALPVNWWLCRRTFDSATAWASTVLLAVLPVNIAYSRLATDPAQSLLATLPLLYLPLLAIREPQRSVRWLLLSLPFLAAAIWVHPTNGLCAFFLPAVALYRWKARWQRRPTPATGAKARPLVLLALGSAFVVALWLLWTQILTPETAPLPSFSPTQALLLARDLGRLLSGVTIYRYFAGSCSQGMPPFGSGIGNSIVPPTLPDSQWMRDILWTDAATIACGIIVLMVLLRRIKAARSEAFSVEAALLLMLIVALVPFYRGVGHVALAPGRERYALWMIAPIALIFARGLIILREDCKSQRTQQAVSALALVIAWSLLAGFYNAYFAWFERTGGTSAPTYRTAQQEPKLAALRHVLAWQKQNAPHAPVWIVGSTWWNFQSLTYLAFKEPGVRVVPHRAGHAWMLKQAAVESQSYETALREGRVWFIGFAGSSESRQFMQQLRARRFSWDEVISNDNGGKPLMLILRVKRSK